MDDNIQVMIREEEVRERLRELGSEISRDYQGRSIYAICVLKGGIYFLCDLSRHIEVPIALDFMAVSSYGAGKTSSGVVKIIKDLDEPIEGKDVLVVEDIIDSGNTLSYLIEILQRRNPRSLEICTLLDKPSRRVVEGIRVKYTGFVIEDKFVVGYGLDYDQKYRNLPYIGCIE